MKSIVTIKGQPIIEVYESFDGSYWFVTEKAWKQDSLLGRKVYKNDQILYGYVRLSSCPDDAEFGYFSEAGGHLGVEKQGFDERCLSRARM